MDTKEYYSQKTQCHSLHVALVPEGENIKVIKISQTDAYRSVHISYIPNLPAAYFRLQRLDKSSREHFSNAWNAALGIQKERQLYLL